MKGTKGAFVRAAVNNNWRSGAATVVGVTQSKNRPSGRGTIKYWLFLASLFKAQGQMPSLIEKQPNPSPWASQPTPPTNILQLQDPVRLVPTNSGVKPKDSTSSELQMWMMMIMMMITLITAGWVQLYQLEKSVIRLLLFWLSSLYFHTGCILNYYVVFGWTCMVCSSLKVG